MPPQDGVISNAAWKQLGANHQAMIKYLSMAILLAEAESMSFKSFASETSAEWRQLDKKKRIEKVKKLAEASSIRFA